MLPEAFILPVISAASVPMGAVAGLWFARKSDHSLAGMSIVPLPGSLTLGMALAAALTLLAPSLSIAGALTGMVFGAIAACDADCFVIPDFLVAVLAILGFTAHPFAPDATALDLAAAAAGALACFTLFAILARALRGPGAFGGGDVKLLAAIGANIGILPLSLVLLAASLLAIFAHIITRASFNAYLPFGTHLVAGTATFLVLAPGIAPYFGSL